MFSGYNKNYIFVNILSFLEIYKLWKVKFEMKCKEKSVFGCLRPVIAHVQYRFSETNYVKAGSQWRRSLPHIIHTIGPAEPRYNLPLQTV